MMRQGKIQGLRFVILLMSAGLAFVCFSVGKPAQAQQRLDMKARDLRTETASASKEVSEPVRLRAQLSQAKSEYKSSLEQLLSLYEAGAKRAEERLPKMKELYEQGLVTRRDMETAEDAAALAREKFVEAQAQLKSAEVQLAEVMVEAEAEESAPKVRLSSPPRAAVGGLVHTTAYIRFGGARAWSLSEAGAIRQFFMQRFGRALPVGAFGQSPLHDRWNYDHRNAMDVGLSPDSAEGQVLMAYLRANGIPFTAFHFAVPGKATGPHIHVGLPSHKIIPR